MASKIFRSFYIFEARLIGRHGAQYKSMSAPCLVDELGILLSEVNQTLHASLYLHELKFAPSGVSIYRLCVEDDPRVSGAKHSPPGRRPFGGPHGNLATLAQMTNKMTPLEGTSSMRTI